MRALPSFLIQVSSRVLSFLRDIVKFYDRYINDSEYARKFATGKYSFFVLREKKT